MSVRISWMDCPAEMSSMAGDMKALRKPWKVRIMPMVKRPCMAWYTPSTSTAEPAKELSSAGIMPRY